MLQIDEGHEAAYNYAPGCSCDDTSGEELELAVLPRHTKVLLGLHGVVTKALGLGGWH
jgi:histone deacetylase complex subunit SAP30